MVSHKTRGAKQRRYTYAERTVTAISDIRKHNPRNSIHLKTLKAQIKRNSDAQKDLLGPQWHARVNTACKELANRGLLDTQHSPGHVSLTPHGKRIIEKTRHSSGLPDDHEHTPDCTENLGRKVIRSLPDSRTKNRRLPSIDTADNDTISRKPPSKMTKAELLAANKKLQSEYQYLKSESARKLAELNAELESRDDELLEYQDKLSGIADSEWEFGDTTLIQDDSDELVDATIAKQAHASGYIAIEVEEPQTPTHSVDHFEPLNTANIASHTLLRRPITLTANSLVRTKSGSFISNISKHPTPAPSDAGTESVPGSPANDFMDIERAVGAERVEVDRGTHMMDLDFFGDGISEDSHASFDPDTTLADNGVESSNKLKTPSAARARIQVHTPMSSPSPQRVLRRNASEADAARRRIERLVDERQEERTEYERKACQLSARDVALKERDDKIRLLELQLADRSKLEEDLRVLREQYEVAEGQLRTVENDKAGLQREIENLQNQLQDKDTDTQALLQQEAQGHENAIAAEKAHSSDLTGQLAEVTQELQSSEISRQTLQGQLEKALTETEAVRSTLQDVIQDLQTNFTDAQSRETVLVQDVRQSREECEHLQAELRVSSERTDEVRAELAGVQSKLYGKTLDKARLELDLAAAYDARCELERTVNTLRNELGSAQRELQTEREGAQALHESLRAVVAQRDELMDELEAKQEALVEVQNSLSLKDTELSLLRDQLRSTQETVTGLQTSVESLKTKLQEATTQKTQLLQTLGEAEEENANLKEGYAKLKRAQMAEFEEMDQRMTKKRKRASMPASMHTPMFGTDDNVDTTMAL